MAHRSPGIQSSPPTLARRLAASAGWGAYGIASAATTVLAAPLFLLRRGGRYRGSVLPRLGWYDGAGSMVAGAADGVGGLWIHAVSVGEVGVAATLAAALPTELPLVITTVTPTGQAQARKAFAGRAAVTYLPFDTGLSVGRFLRRFQPRALILVEGDLWPRALREARRHGLRPTVVNGRISDRSFARLRKLGSLATRYYRQVEQLGVQTEGDRRRLLELGLGEDRVTVTGNLKFDTPEPPPKPLLEAAIARWADGRPVVVAGSTMAGEDEMVLDAWQRAGGEDVLLLLAPRHPERFSEVARLLQRRGLRFLRRSEMLATAAAEPKSSTDPNLEPVAESRPEVVLLDTLGELAGTYRGAAAAFVGGTLVPTGGHNPIEPARFGVPVAVGPSMANFREIAGFFDDADAWGRAADAADLGRIWQRWLEQPEVRREVGVRGRELVASHRGATGRTLELLGPLLAPLDQASADTMVPDL